eukprot:symbB.v1.2.018676.t3/scaffold1410.1/size216244/2
MIARQSFESVRDNIPMAFGELRLQGTCCGNAASKPHRKFQGGEMFPSYVWKLCSQAEPSRLLTLCQRETTIQSTEVTVLLPMAMSKSSLICWLLCLTLSGSWLVGFVLQPSRVNSLVVRRSHATSESSLESGRRLAAAAAATVVARCSVCGVCREKVVVSGHTDGSLVCPPKS